LTEKYRNANDSSAKIFIPFDKDGNIYFNPLILQPFVADKINDEFHWSGNNTKDVEFEQAFINKPHFIEEMIQDLVFNKIASNIILTQEEWNECKDKFIEIYQDVKIKKIHLISEITNKLTYDTNYKFFLRFVLRLLKLLMLKN